MKLTLTCPRASYDGQMRIQCAGGGLCGHQRYKPCKGWCVLTEQAGRCPLRTKGDSDERKDETASRCRH